MGHALDPALLRRITVLSCAGFASAAATRIADALLPSLAREFAITPGAAAAVVSAFSMAYGILQLVFGPVGDRYPKFRVVTWATLACALFATAAAAMRDFDGLVLLRMLTGAANAALIPLAMAWIADQVPYERRQPVLARFLTGQVLGLGGGQMLGGVLVDLSGWRAALAASAAIYALVFVLLLLELRRMRAADADALPAAARPSSPLAGYAAVLSNPWARRLLVWVYIEGALQVGAMAFVPTYLHQRFDLPLSLSGGTMVLFSLGGFAYTRLARALLARHAEHGLALAGGVLLGVAFLLLALGPHVGWSVPAGLVMGLGFYMLHATMQTHATQMAPNARGTAVALFASSLFLGQASGVWLAARVSDLWGLRAVFATSSLGLLLVGLTFAAALRARHVRG